jgi:hypothetical protein
MRQSIEELQQAIFKKIKLQMHQEDAAPAKVIPLYSNNRFRFSAAASAIILVVSVGFLFLPASKKSSPLVKKYSCF